MEFILVQKYPKGVAHEINCTNIQFLVHLFEDSCKKYNDQVAFENMGVTAHL